MNKPDWERVASYDHTLYIFEYGSSENVTSMWNRFDREQFVYGESYNEQSVGVG